MPIVSIDVRDGDPTIQASGQHRGTVMATFADGRIIERNLRAPDADAWQDLIAGISAKIQAQAEEQDAENSVDPGTEVEAAGEASEDQAAAAYIRNSLSQEFALDAWLRLSRFKNWVDANGGNFNAVEARLLAAGVSQEDWDTAKTIYQYLSGAGRAETLLQAKTIQTKWEER